MGLRVGQGLHRLDLQEMQALVLAVAAAACGRVRLHPRCR